MVRRVASELQEVRQSSNEDFLLVLSTLNPTCRAVIEGMSRFPEWSERGTEVFAERFLAGRPLEARDIVWSEYFLCGVMATLCSAVRRMHEEPGCIWDVPLSRSWARSLLPETIREHLPCCDDGECLRDAAARLCKAVTGKSSLEWRAADLGWALEVLKCAWSMVSQIATIRAVRRT